MGENCVSVYLFISDTVTIAKVFDHTVAYGDMEFSLEYDTWDDESIEDIISSIVNLILEINEKVKIAELTNQQEEE